MKLAVVASDPDSLLRILQHYQLDQYPELVVWSPSAPAATTHLPSLSHWDLLLTTHRVDVLIMSGVSPELLTIARQVVQLGTSIRVLMDSTDRPEPLFQFTPLWREFPDRVAPLYPLPIHRRIMEGRQPLAGHGTGQVWRVSITRQLPTSGPRLRQSQVDHWLLLDLAWITATFSWPERITMQLTGASPDDCREALVVLEGGSLPEIRWILQSGNSASCELKLSIEGAEMTIPEISLPPDPERPASVLQSVISWTDVLRIGEIGATARKSQCRHRTVDVRFEDSSERAQFKSQMAAIGCGVLLWCLFGSICLLILGRVLDPRDAEYRAATAAGRVLTLADFAPDTVTLTHEGAARLKDIADHWDDGPGVLIIEAANSPLDAIRQQSIEQQLHRPERELPPESINTRTIPGRWYERLMKLGWLLVFGPLAVALMLQGLLTLTKGSQ